MSNKKPEPAKEAEGKKTAVEVEAETEAEERHRPRKRGSRDLPVLKYTRRREYAGKRPGRVKHLVEGFFVPGPRAAEYEKRTGRKYICPAGPGMKPIPDGGQWYPVTVYLLRRVRDGDAAEGVPPKDEHKDIKLAAEGGKG